MNAIAPAAPVPDERARRFARLGLLLICAVDAGLQLVFWLSRAPFGGLGVLAVPLFPIIAAYYLVMLSAIIGGVPLAIACFVTRRRMLVVAGAVLVALTAVNARNVLAGYAGLQAGQREQARAEEAHASRIARCSEEIDRVLARARADFAEPRRVVALGPHTSVGLDNGMRVALPFRVAPDVFQRFYYERLVGAPVRVVLRDDARGGREAWCSTLAPHEPQTRAAGEARQGIAAPDVQDTRDGRGRSAAPVQASGTVVVDELPGDLYLDDKRIEPTSDLARDFPLPAAAAEATSTIVVARLVDAHSGDRTYAAGRGPAPPAGYTPEGATFRIRRERFDGSRALYLCNAPFQRPSSPEHFLSLDSECEGRDIERLLGYIGASRDSRTPRALLRCLRTVQAPLMTNSRHLVTSDVRECGDGRIEAVMGFVG